MNPLIGTKISCRTLCKIVIDPTYKSPPYVCNPRFITIVIALSVAAIINGDTPNASIEPRIFTSGFKSEIRRWICDFAEIRKRSTQTALNACEITVAVAAPTTPISRTKMKTGSRIMLTIAPINTEIIAVLAYP